VNDFALLGHIFVLFTRVALFSWGGGPASLALMQRETTAAGWVTSSEFADAVALGNALPGPIAPQVSAYVGYKLAGTPGAVAAAAGTVIPTTVLMLALIVAFFSLKNSPLVQSMLRAVRPVVIGLLVWTAYDMARSVFGVQKLGWGPALARGLDGVAIAAVAFVLLTFTRINPVFVILGEGPEVRRCRRSKGLEGRTVGLSDLRTFSPYPPASRPTTVVHSRTRHRVTRPFSTYGSACAKCSATAGDSPRKSRTAPSTGLASAPPSTSSPRAMAACACARCVSRKSFRRST